ncbi:MAG: hypothetical protein J0H49_25000 [Acidobacteria bacterium]|nr:hypothetical protein [Acidobacteriota bacterium]
MRRDDAFFGDQELVLIYIGKRLSESKAVEKLLDEADLDYLVEPDRYRGGVLFIRELIGAFFYVTEDKADTARDLLRAAKHAVYVPGGQPAT